MNPVTLDTELYKQLMALPLKDRGIYQDPREVMRLVVHIQEYHKAQLPEA